MLIYLPTATLRLTCQKDDAVDDHHRYEVWLTCPRFLQLFHAVWEVVAVHGGGGVVDRGEDHDGVTSGLPVKCVDWTRTAAVVPKKIHPCDKLTVLTHKVTAEFNAKFSEIVFGVGETGSAFFRVCREVFGVVVCRCAAFPFTIWHCVIGIYPGIEKQFTNYRVCALISVRCCFGCGGVMLWY